MELGDIVHTINDLPVQNDRLIVGVAGPPASGKTTLAEKLAARLKNTALVPMDGFHLSNQRLDELDLRQRKGAPETFAAADFIKLVKNIRLGNLPVEIPEFDREQDRVVNRHNIVDDTHRIILLEGNYLLLDESPWRELKPLFDYSIFLNPGLDIIHQRITSRWLGFGFSPEQAEIKANHNDMPNAKRVKQNSLSADLMLHIVAYS